MANLLIWQAIPEEMKMYKVESEELSATLEKCHGRIVGLVGNTRELEELIMSVPIDTLEEVGKGSPGVGPFERVFNTGYLM